jgi:LacI family transcriptional regulator
VIIASNDDMAAGALFEVREQGLSVPSDMSLVGFDDTPLASHVWPPMTTVRQPIVEMADAAVRTLIRTISGEELTNRTTDFNCEVILRQSTAPPLDSDI